MCLDNTTARAACDTQSPQATPPWPHSCALVECLFLLSPFCCGCLFRYKKGLREAVQHVSMELLTNYKIASRALKQVFTQSLVTMVSIYFISAHLQLVLRAGDAEKRLPHWCLSEHFLESLTFSSQCFHVLNDR
jgi:hypothetical protein